MKIRDANVFITGANRGIGLAFARHAHAMGAAKIYAGVRDLDRLSEPGVIPVRIDVTDPATVAEAVRQADDTTILINNAGIIATVENAFDARVEELSRHLFEVNYYGLIRATQAFAPVLGRGAESAVVNMLSIMSWAVRPPVTAYAASKAAAWSYVNQSRAALQAQNTSVLAVHVSTVDTDAVKAIDAPKEKPETVARETLQALEDGRSEVIIGERTRAVKDSLSSETPAYIVVRQAA